MNSIDVNSDESSHPSIEDLANYHAGVLSDFGSESIRTHLTQCPSCAEFEHELAELIEDGNVAELSNFEKKAAWRRQRKSLLKTSTLHTNPQPWRRIQSPILGWAAALIIAFMGTFSISTLHSQVRVLEGPHFIQSLVDLEPAGSVREMAVDIKRLRLPNSTSRGWIVLYPENVDGYSDFWIEVHGPNRNFINKYDGIVLSESETVRISVSRDFLPPGICKIMLFGAHGDRTAILGEFPLMILYE